MIHYPPIFDEGYVWITTPRLAKEFHKCNKAIWQWCNSGYITTIGYRLRRDPKGLYRIGVRAEEYLNFVSR